MPRSKKVFKKRKAVYFKGRRSVSSNDIVGSEIPKSENEILTSETLCSKEKKLNHDRYSMFEEYNTSRNIIIDVSILEKIFEDAVCCKTCHSKLKLNVADHNAGLSITMNLMCTSCKFKYDFQSSDTHSDTKISTINTSFVYAMRSIGKGAEAGRLFCAVMNLPQPPSKFGLYNDIILRASKEVCENSLARAAYEAINHEGKNISVAVDGSWQKRGYTSLNGVVTATSIESGKVLDVEVLSKHCLCEDKKNHEESCKSNFQGVSGMMEVEGATRIFERSLKKHHARYLTYLGDGDSKAFEAIKKKNVYGDEYQIEKVECIGHVMKRMGGRLRKLKSNMTGKVLSDGKKLSGKNRLTNHEIDKIQNYYGLAIRRNLDSVDKMRQAIWAIFLHKLSNDDKPQHGFCPPGEESWCKYRKAEALGLRYSHQSNLPICVVEAMRPIFKDLSNPELLRRCVHGQTQNPNESLNNVIWSRLPKTTFVHLDVLKLGVYDAVSTFNDGNVIKLQVLEELGIDPGFYACKALKLIDKEKLSKAKYSHLEQSKVRRISKRLKGRQENAKVEKLGVKTGYAAGMF